MFVELITIILAKEFVEPKGMFRNICRQHPFEFLLMINLCREWENMHAKILMCSCMFHAKISLRRPWLCEKDNSFSLQMQGKAYLFCPFQ